MEEFPDEMWPADEGLLLARLAGLPPPVSITRGRLVGSGPNLQQISKGQDWIEAAFTPSKPEWQIVEFDSSDVGYGRETRVVVHKSAAVGMSTVMTHGGRRAGLTAAIRQSLAFAADQKLAQPWPSLGMRRPTKISAVVRSALEHWASAK